MSEVVPLHKGQHTGERVVEPVTVETLERLLEKAKSGEIIGLAGAVLYHDKGAGQICVGWKNFAQVGALQCVMVGLANELNKL